VHKLDPGTNHPLFAADVIGAALIFGAASD